MKHYRDKWSMELNEAIANQMMYDDSVNNRKYEFIRTFVKHLNDAKMYKGSYSVDSNEIFVIDIPDKYRNLDCIWIESPKIEECIDIYEAKGFISGHASKYIILRVLRPMSYGCRFIIELSYWSDIVWKDDPEELSTESKQIQKKFLKIIEASLDEMNHKRKEERERKKKNERL